MDNYPPLPQIEGNTKPAPRSGIRPRVASNGNVRLRALQSATKNDWVIDHGVLTDAQWATLLAFYNSHRTDAFILTLEKDSSTLVCVFNPDSPYDAQPMEAGLWRVAVRLMEQ